MAKRQTRRTISLSRGLMDSLKVYAEGADVAVSAYAEFILEHAVASPLDTTAFNAWHAAREGRLEVVRMGGLEAYRLRHAKSEESAAEFRRLREDRLRVLAEATARRVARREARAELQRAEAERRRLRKESQRGYLCRQCDRPGHNRSTCPELYPTPKETGSPSEMAAKHRAKHGGTLAEVAQAFGVSRQAISQQWARLYAERRGERC